MCPLVSKSKSILRCVPYRRSWVRVPLNAFLPHPCNQSNTSRFGVPRTKQIHNNIQLILRTLATIHSFEPWTCNHLVHFQLSAPGPQKTIYWKIHDSSTDPAEARASIAVYSWRPTDVCQMLNAAQRGLERATNGGNLQKSEYVLPLERTCPFRQTGCFAASPAVYVPTSKKRK